MEESAYVKAYVKLYRYLHHMSLHGTRLVAVCIMNGCNTQTELLSRDFAQIEHTIQENPEYIDILIECAIDNNVPYEHRAFLIDYKYKHGVFKEKDWRL